MWKKKNNSLVAIDLAPDALRLLDVSLRHATPAILALGSETLPPGTPETLPDRHIAALDRLLSVHRLRGRPCVASIPTSLVTTRSLMIDPAKPGLPEDQIRQTLQSILSCDPRDLIFDFWNVAPPNDKSRTSEVLVVAVHQAIVHKYLDAFARLGLSCRHLDVAPCALAALLARLLPQQDSMVGTMVLGDTLGYFAVVAQQRLLFWRPFDLPAQKNGAPSALERIGHEISKCVSHMVGTQHMEALADIVVFGNGVRDEQFTTYLAQRFNLRVRTPSPFEALPQGALAQSVAAALQPEAATHFAAALGLAFQHPGGNHG
jgi:Tfp pilus assembly PilM family ATPase